MNWAAKRRTESANGRGIEMLQALCLNKREKSMNSISSSAWDSYDPQEASNAWPLGPYEATITEVVHAESKKTGDPMIVVHFKAFNKRGETQVIREYITKPEPDSGRKGSFFKYRQIADAVGMGKEFKDKTLRPHHLLNKNVTLILGVESNSQYGDQNRIENYEPISRHSAANTPVRDEDVPF